MEPLQFNSLAGMFFSVCARHGFGGWYKRIDSQWVHYSGNELRDTAISVAVALNSRGLGARESVGIIAPSSPEWILADIAIQINHARTVPLFPNISSENFQFQCDNSEVKILFVNSVAELEDPLKQFLGQFKLVICIDPKSSLPENAQRPLEPGEESRPLLEPAKNYTEITPYSDEFAAFMQDAVVAEAHKVLDNVQ